jgi:DNA-3-methyladenine glycosylase
MERLGTEFFVRDAVTVAHDLVGKHLIRRLDGSEVVCRIVETEAYMGPTDKASHAYKNRASKRTEVFYRRGGYLYIYFIYGMYYCCNIITNVADRPEAVLLRAVEPLAGIDVIRKRRNTQRPRDLTNGPGKLCQALDIDGRLYGYDVTEGQELWLEDPHETFPVIASVRINIDYAGEYRDKPWRFYIEDSPFVSR